MPFDENSDDPWHGGDGGGEDSHNTDGIDACADAGMSSTIVSAIANEMCVPCALLSVAGMSLAFVVHAEKQAGSEMTDEELFEAAMNAVKQSAQQYIARGIRKRDK